MPYDAYPPSGRLVSRICRRCSWRDSQHIGGECPKLCNFCGESVGEYVDPFNCLPTRVCESCVALGFFVKKLTEQDIREHEEAMKRREVK